MIGVNASLTSRVEEVYRTSPADPRLEGLLQSLECSTDEELAELIEVDGRTRIALNRSVSLTRYLEAVPDLGERELSLDAAIDVSLRALSGGARPTDQAIERLIESYPEYGDAIKDAALLGRAVVSTTGVGHLVRSTPQRAVPSDFGPAGQDGVARYHLTQVLGSGSTGEVYLAIDRLLSEPDKPAHVAIKVIGVKRTSTRARLELSEEASKARRVIHDHVVRVLDRGISEQGEDYIIYEHVEGGDLDRWIDASGPLVNIQQAALMVAQIARGLQAAHIACLVHCDLKPSNILVSSSGIPKVADFGIAVRESDLAALAGQTLRPMGNVAFISPEQYRGEAGSLGVSSDVYALGGILYYLLTGELPNGATVEEVARCHDLQSGRSAAPDPRLLRPQIDRDLAAVCRRAMALAPGERHASAAALADDLQAWVRKEPITWLRPSMWKVLRLGARRRPGFAIALVVAFVSIISGAGAGGYWASVASRNRTRADNAEGSINRVRDGMDGVRGFVKMMSEGSNKEDMILLSVALEQMVGSWQMRTIEERTEYWGLRIDNARGLVQEYINEGKAHDVETLLWQGVLAYWLLNAHRPEEALEILGPLIPKLEERGLAGDSLTEQCRRLRAAGTALQLDAKAAKGPLTAEERESLVPLERDVARAAESRGIRGGLPSRGRLLEALMVLNSPRLLDRPVEFENARKAYTDHQKGMENVGVGPSAKDVEKIKAYFKKKPRK